MKELQVIYEEVQRAFGVDIKIRCREQVYIMARYCYYSFSKKTTLYKDDVISGFINYDRTTLLNSMKKRYTYENQFPEYKHMFVDFYFYMKQRSEEISMEDMELLTTQQFEIKTLKRKLRLSETNLSQTKFKLKNAREGMPNEILNLIGLYTKEEIDEFIKYKVNPAIVMKLSQHRRLLDYNPRGKELAV